MKSLTFLIALVVAAASFPRNCCEAYSSVWTSKKEEPAAAANDDKTSDVEISPKCASVILAAKTAVLGGASAYLLTPAALCVAGFCATGVTGGSFAAWWQSTMPLIAKGSLFAQLQALAMGGGRSTTTVAAGAVGGAVSAMFLKDFCKFVDASDPSDVGMGQVFHETHQLVISAIETKDKAKDMCAASETCTSLINAASDAKTAAVDSISAAWSSLSDVVGSTLKSTMETPEMQETLSSAWNSLKEGASTLKTKVVASELGTLAAESISSAWSSLKAGTEIYILQVEIEKQKHEFGVLTFEFLRKMRHASWIDKTLKEMYEVSLEKVRALEKMIEEKLLNNPDDSKTRRRRLERKINKEKEEFGTLAFDYLLQSKKSNLNDPELTGIYKEKLKAISDIEMRILRKQTTQMVVKEL